MTGLYRQLLLQLAQWLQGSFPPRALSLLGFLLSLRTAVCTRVQYRKPHVKMSRQSVWAR